MAATEPWFVLAEVDAAGVPVVDDVPILLAVAEDEAEAAAAARHGERSVDGEGRWIARPHLHFPEDRRYVSSAGWDIA